MNTLPPKKNISVELLSACLNKTTLTYKFYWFLSIIQTIEDEYPRKRKIFRIKKREVFARMISNAWYTHNYFKISFGVNDQLNIAIEKIKKEEEIKVDADQTTIVSKILGSNNKNTTKILNHFDNEVPHRFLSPWFKGKNKEEVYLASNDLQNNSPYSLEKDFIIIHNKWLEYFLKNAGVLKDFCFWNLAIYIQARNPGVPDIPIKLIKPEARNGLNKQKIEFWDIVIREKQDLKCIYTSKTLKIGDYALDHFIPHNFLPNNNIWNLVPSDRLFNCKKSDYLPPLEKYFEHFFLIQKSALEVMKDNGMRKKYFLEYLHICPSVNDCNKLFQKFTRERFRERIQPLITIAANNGFEYMK